MLRLIQSYLWWWIGKDKKMEENWSYSMRKVIEQLALCNSLGGVKKCHFSLNPWIWQWILRNDTKKAWATSEKKRLKNDNRQEASCNEKDSELETEVWVLLLIQDPEQIFAIPSFHSPVHKRRGKISEVPSRVVTDCPCLSVFTTSPGARFWSLQAQRLTANSKVGTSP